MVKLKLLNELCQYYTAIMPLKIENVLGNCLQLLFNHGEHGVFSQRTQRGRKKEKRVMHVFLFNHGKHGVLLTKNKRRKKKEKGVVDVLLF